ncbi:TetR/AcrR family transcriptional regulator [Cohnella sp. NL03-T5]|uniref:TetR/AcrR family transcriptional regulator n=1 Tax=Cohnella silvisoli TaxID=2873699 RepID=A0ABV1KMJ7_9BACL|nr:TetR/AcrR family transcriptional regulator [Cohnella silvisoli]
MATKQEQRSEDTKKSILSAAGELFASKGYDSVTMREIAKEAGCSHTTIYIYFKDKEALLQQLALPPLQALRSQMDAFSIQSDKPEKILENISLTFIAFCLNNRNMYDLFFSVKSVRVDEKAPALEINQARNELFGKLTDALQACLPLEPNDDRLLTYTRIYFFTLHGIVSTYTHSEETVEQLLERLTSTFRTAFEVLLSGFRQRE